MDKSSILKKIVEEKGNCCWSKPSICAACPLSKLKQKPDGSWMSCVEAVGITDMTEEEADAKYLEIATRLLVDESIEDILGDNGTK
jgi:hypothetical protein